jgi:hypothetical protein
MMDQLHTNDGKDSDEYGQDCADLAEHVTIERGHKGGQTVPKEEQNRTPTSQR